MLSLYVHIPFCVKKCRYCGFYSTEYSHERADAFVTALQGESSRYKERFRDTVFDTIYIGGGTPTALAPDQLKRIIAILREQFNSESAGEFTVESNPNSLTPHLLDLLREQGVNRVSIGVQSFSDELLHVLGRAHTAEEARAAVGMARAAGFTNVGIDLLYGIPRQRLQDWMEVLEEAISLRPEHISAYSLSLDEGSQFTREAEAGRFALPDDRAVVQLSTAALKALTGAGYAQYEIANYSLPGLACRHNMNYWKRGEYLGLGPSAWSFFDGRRYRNCGDVRTYCSRISAGRTPVEYAEQLTPDQGALETIMLGMRMEKGIALRDFCTEQGEEQLDRLLKNSEELMRRGLVGLTADHLHLTAGGTHLSDSIIEILTT